MRWWLTPVAAGAAVGLVGVAATVAVTDATTLSGDDIAAHKIAAIHACEAWGSVVFHSPGTPQVADPEWQRFYGNETTYLKTSYIGEALSPDTPPELRAVIEDWVHAYRRRSYYTVVEDLPAGASELKRDPREMDAANAEARAHNTVLRLCRPVMAGHTAALKEPLSEPSAGWRQDDPAAPWNNEPAAPTVCPADPWSPNYKPGPPKPAAWPMLWTCD